MTAADPLKVIASAGGENTRSVLRVIILALIAAAAVSSRLFSVIRTWHFWSILMLESIGGVSIA